ncbi:MAG: tetratricopeptide repeat protein [Chitinophagaceae bacterium]|nr:tetratricopeptide repeat protein [Chitinophagaceae bacterium]MDB5223669.1 tetratricopeptide repeat protein [Chitinophagaceae bacterium]
MRKIIVSILSMLFLTAIAIPSFSQKKSEAKTMTWTSSSKEAKELAQTGAGRLMNAEFALAYQDFLAAVKLDPDFTVALTFLSNLTTGATQKSYAQRALKSSANKTEGEKLFASIADEKNTRESRREIWSKLHTMFPDGSMIGHFYVVTRATPDEQFAAAQDYIKKFPNAAAMYNNLAYYYLNEKKDNVKAKENFEKYISLYPEGYNPYDSMGEFYLLTGDMENSKKYYSLSLEKYPFNESSITALQKMEDDKKKMEAKK